MTRTALVTGANRGIGLATAAALAAAGHRVLLGARHPERGEAAAARLRAGGGDVRAEVLDVADAASVAALAARLDAAGVDVDVLVNNAGTYPTTPFPAVTEDVLDAALGVHVVGAFRTCRAFVPGMVARGWGRVVNVSSSAGQLGDGVPGPAAYGVAKAALNALTRVVADSVAGDVKVNAACPGWVRTDMGGPAAPRSVEEGADTVVWLATLPSDGPNDGFFRDRRPIPW